MCNEAWPGFHDFCAQHKCASFFAYFVSDKRCAMKLSSDEPFFCERQGGAGAGDIVTDSYWVGLCLVHVAISLHPKYVFALPIPCHCICSQERWNFVGWGGSMLTVLVTTSGNYLTHITERTWGGLVDELCSPLEIIHNESVSIDVQSWESGHWQEFLLCAEDPEEFEREDCTANAAIDDVSAQLRSLDGFGNPNETMQSLNQPLYRSRGRTESYLILTAFWWGATLSSLSIAVKEWAWKHWVHTSLISVFLLLKISELCGWVGFVRKRWTLSGYKLPVVEPGPAGFWTTFFTLWMQSEFGEFCSVCLWLDVFISNL
jgi:hypothetical protein